MSYRGRFIPTENYKEGYVFDQSFTGTFDATTANPTRSVAGGFIDGFTTALLKMHPGDHSAGVHSIPVGLWRERQFINSGLFNAPF